MMAFGAKIKLSVNTSNASAFRSEIQKFTNKATADNPIKLKNFSVSMTKQQRSIIIKDLQTYLANDSSLVLKIGTIDASGAVNKLRQQLQTMLSGLSITGVKEFLGESNIDKVVKDINAAEQSAKRLASQMEVVNSIRDNLKYTDISKLSDNQTYSGDSEVKNAVSAYDELKAKINEIKSSKAELSEEDIAALQKEEEALQQTISTIEEKYKINIRTSKEAIKAEEEAAAAAKKQLDLSKQQASLKKQVQQYIMSNSKAYKHFGDELDGMMLKLSSSGELTEEELKEIRTRLYDVQMAAKSAGYSGNTFFDTMKKGFAKFGGWSLVTRSLTAVYRIFKDMVKAVQEVDAAMTELRKVTDLSEQSYANYLKTAQQTSQAVGATLADTINSTADFARLGYSLADASSLSEAALVYKNVGDGIEDIGESSESLISTIKAFEQFGESANNAMSIVDRFNEVGNNFAISSEGIGAALQRSASSMAAAGNTLNESIALITGMNAVVQDPEKVGTALKTVSMFLRAAKTDAEEAGESTEGMANSVSELRKELLTLTKGKVDIMIDDTTFKSTYQIMKELSQVWNELSDIDTANILELIGGKRNANAVTSLLTNFEDAESALQTAANASGSALRENEKYIDSIAGKISVFQSKFESFSNNLIDSGAVKFVVDLGSVLLSFLDILEKIYLLLPLIGISASAIINKIQGSNISSITSQIMLQKKSIMESGAATESLAISISALNKQQLKSLAIQLNKKRVSKEISEEEYKQILSTMGLTVTEKGLVAANGELIISNKVLGSSFKSLMASIPIAGWIALGISLVLEFATVIGDLVGNIETSAQKISRLDDEMGNITSDIQNVANEYKDLKSSTDEIIPRFTELAKGVDEFGNKVSLTDEEYEEFIELNNKIAQIFPELDAGFDENGNHILALSYSVNTLTESLEQLVEAERMAANEKSAGKIKDSLKNMKEADKEYKNQIKDARDNLKEIESFYNRVKSGGNPYSNPNNGSLSDAGYNEWGKILGVSAENHSTQKSTGRGYVEIPNYEFVYDKDELERNYQNYIKSQENIISSIEEKQKRRWQKLNPIMGAWLQTTTEFDIADDNVQDLLSKIVGNIDYSKIGITNETKLKEYLTNNFIKPIADAEPEVQNAMIGMFNMKSAFESGNLTVGEYGVTDYILGELKNTYNISDEILGTLTNTLGLDKFKEQLNTVKTSIKGDTEDIQKYIDNLSYRDFTFAYKVIEKDGSMSLEELQEKAKQLRYKQAEMVEPLNMGDFVDGLGKTAEAVDKLTSAMAKLKEGTSLTKGEMMQLVEEYPKLLEQSNIFTDGTIQSQKNALNAILDLKEQEYDAQIDTKIAELKATETVLNNQLELEEEKANVIQEIKNLETNGKITQETEFINKLSELNDLQGQNYVDFKDGELQVNEEALNDQLEQDVNYGDAAVKNVWQPYGDSIVQSHEQAYSGSLVATNGYLKKLWNRIKDFFTNFTSAVANLWGDLKEGNIESLGDLGKYFKGVFSGGNTDVSGGVVRVNFGGEKTTVNGQNVDEWISDQQKASDYRIAEINKIKTKTLNAINNLEALKKLDLTTVYGTTSKKKSKKEIEEYIASIDELYDAVKRLEEVQKLRENLEDELSHTDDAAAKIKLYDKLTDVYKEEAAAEKNLINERKNLIQKNIKDLRALGFQVSYNSETNELYIKNLEHLNEITAKSKGKYETLQEATNELRKETEKLIDTTETLNDDNAQSVDNIENLVYEIQDAAEEIISCIEEVYDKQIDSYNKIIEKRKEAIESAKEEYDYEEEIAEKVKEIADLQSRIDKLSLDNSREAQVKKNELVNELNELQKDLRDTQRDYSYDNQIDSLEKMSEKYEEEKNSELELLKQSIGTVQDLGTNIDERITNAWKNAKKAVEEYGECVNRLNVGSTATVGVVPKYHTGGVVGGNVSEKEEVFALLQAGEIVLNDDEQDSVYRIIDFQTELSKRLGVSLRNANLAFDNLNMTHSIGDTTPNIVDNSNKTIFSPEISVEIYHNGDMSDGDAHHYGEEIAETAITKLYNAFERKGISYRSGSKLRP